MSVKRKNALNLNIILEKTQFIRLALSSVLFAFMLIFSSGSKAELLILAVSALLAGADLFSASYDDIRIGNYFSYSLILIISGIVCFLLSFRYEAVAMLILYRIGLYLIRYTTEKTKTSAIELIAPEDADISGYTKDVIEDDSKLQLEYTQNITASSGIFLKAIAVIGIIYAILMPLIAKYNITVSIHRAIAIILVSNPFSLIAGIKACSAVGIGFAASKGSIFSNAEALEMISAPKVAIFNKNKLFIEETPVILSVKSQIVDEDTFMNLVSHLVYDSELDFCKAIVSARRYKYQPNMVMDMKDIDNCGVEGTISGSQVIFGTLDFMQERGIEPTDESDIDGDYYYLAVSGRYAGCIVLSRSYSLAAEDIVSGLRERGVTKNILLSSHSIELTSAFSAMNGFDEYKAEQTSDQISEDIQAICEKGRYKKLYIYADKIQSHSSADIDFKIGIVPEQEDVLVIPEYLELMPQSIDISRRMLDIIKQNVIFVFAIKGLLIFLAMIGFSNPWFAVFIDMASALATILNAIRITSSTSLKANF